MTLNKALPVMLVLIVAASWMKFPDVNAASPTVTLTSVYNIAEAGTTVLVNITIADVSDLMMWIADISYDPSVIQISTGDPTGLYRSGVHYGIYEGSFLKSIRSTVFAVNGINTTEGAISSLAAGYLNPGTSGEGSGILATINFTIIRVGTTTINMTGPSTEHPGQSMLVSHLGKEIDHDDVQGTISDEGPPPPPPVWTQLWFQVTLPVIAVAVVAVYIVIKVVVPARQRAKAKEAQEIVEEQEEVEKEFF